MKNLSGIPFFEIEFTKDGAIHKQTELDNLLSGINKEDFTDLVIISHGWNNDMEEALDLYTRIFAFVADELDRANLENRKFGVLGIYWPSKKFAEQSLIAGGAASLGDPDGLINAQLDKLKGFFDSDSANEHLLQIKSVVNQSGDIDQLSGAIADLFATLNENAGKQGVEDSFQQINNENVQELLVALQFTIVEPVDEPAQGGLQL